MTVDPRSLAHTPVSMPEWPEYVLLQLKDLASALDKKLEAKADRSELSSVWKTAEFLFARRDEVLQIAAAVPEPYKIAELISSLNTLSTKIESIKAALITHAEKLDTDFAAQNLVVTDSDLDEDYTSSLNID